MGVVCFVFALLHFHSMPRVIARLPVMLARLERDRMPGIFSVLPIPISRIAFWRRRLLSLLAEPQYVLLSGGGDVLLERSGRGLQVTCGHSSRPSSTYALTSFSGCPYSRMSNASPH